MPVAVGLRAHQLCSRGLGWTIPKLAEAICDLADCWGVTRAEGAADDAIFAQHGHAGGSIADEFKQCDVHFWPAAKGDRRSGWERMRRLLEATGEPDVPGLCIGGE